MTGVPSPLRVRAALALLLAPALAGCAGPAPADPDPGPEAPAGPAAALRFAHVQAAAGCAPCWEPTVAADPEGRVFVTWGGAPGILVAPAPAGPFEELAMPPLPPGAPPTAARGDETLDVDPLGRLFFSALLSLVAGGDIGIQVARSDDGGRTWPVNAFYSVAAAGSVPPAPAFYMDRQWLGFGPEGDVFLAYWQWVPRSGIWLARSDDGGATFGLPTLVASTVERFGDAGSPGIPVATADLLVVPFTARTAPLGPGAMMMALSRDRGATFEKVPVHATGGFVMGLPRAAIGASGTVHAAWALGTGEVQAASSHDGGRTWSEPARWNADDDQAVMSPHALLHGDTLGALWYSRDGEASWRLTYAASEATAAPAEGGRVVLATGIPSQTGAGGAGGNHAGTTDFPHFALLPGGRAVAAWSDAEAVRLSVQEPGAGLTRPAA